MEGAFAIWDPLLEELCVNQQVCVGLANQLLKRLTDITLVANAANAESEALYLWLVHLLEYKSIATAKFFATTIRATILKTCTLHPGFWTQKLAQEILAGDEDLKSVWQDLLAAAAISQQPGGADVADGAGGSETAGGDEDRSMLAQLDEIDDSVGWRRASTRPKKPIGVVT
jgi:hypothetical protein